MDLKNLSFDKKKLDLLADDLEVINILAEDLKSNKSFMRKLKKFQKKQEKASKDLISYNTTKLKKEKFELKYKGKIKLSTAENINANSKCFSDNLPLCG